MSHQENLFNIPDPTPKRVRNHIGRFSHKIDKRKPQKMVRLHLECGMKITGEECYKYYGSMELRKIISNLIGEGLKIKKEWFTEPSGKRYKIYKLKSE